MMMMTTTIAGIPYDNGRRRQLPPSQGFFFPFIFTLLSPPPYLDAPLSFNFLICFQTLIATPSWGGFILFWPQRRLHLSGVYFILMVVYFDEMPLLGGTYYFDDGDACHPSQGLLFCFDDDGTALFFFSSSFFYPRRIYFVLLSRAPPCLKDEQGPF